MKQEIETWRLINYAARVDDSLSVQSLWLVDRNLVQKNGTEEEL